MENPNGTKPTLLGRMVKSVQGLLNKLATLLAQGADSPFVVFVPAVIFTGIGWFLDSPHWLSFAGLYWMTLFTLIFFLFIHLESNYEQILRGITLMKKGMPLAKAIPLPKQEQQEAKDEIVEKANVFLNLGEKGLKWAYKNTYTAASLVITLAHIATLFHLAAASGKPKNFVDFNQVSWFSIVYIVILPIWGIVSDKLNKIYQSKKFGRQIFVFGPLQIYLGSIILLSGLFGGRIPIQAINILMKQPWLFFSIDLFYYPDAYSYHLSHGLGPWFFGVLYLLTPLATLMMMRSELRLFSNYGRASLPIITVYSLLATGLYLLSIGLLVAFHEGWLQQLFEWISAGVQYLIHFFQAMGK